MGHRLWRSPRSAAGPRSLGAVLLPMFAVVVAGLFVMGPLAGLARSASDCESAATQIVGTPDCVGADTAETVVGTSLSGRLPNDSAYAPFRSLGIGAQAGDVPPLFAQPIDGDEWSFESWGSPDAAQSRLHPGERIASIAVSADGDEGWAVGPGIGSGHLTLYRFDDTTWRRCDIDGVRDGAVLAPDEECAGLADLRSRGLILSSIATVDPGADRFEAVAVGWLPAAAGQQVSAVIVRYRDGRWTVEEPPSHPAFGRRYLLHSVAFTGPDDGWAYGRSASSDTDAVMLRFHDGRWTGCTQPDACDDAGILPDRRYTPPATGPALIAAGDRVFLAGTRSVVTSKLPESYYPVILSHRRGGRWEDADGLDPAGPGKKPDPTKQGRITSFAVAARSDSRVEGWARQGRADGGPSTVTLRLAPGGGWKPWVPPARADALRDHSSRAEVQAMVSGGEGDASASFMTSSGGPLLRFDTAEQRWRVLAAPFDPSGANPFTARTFRAMSPDGQGGLWVVHEGPGSGPFFHRYTRHRRRPVFADVPQPFVGGRIRHLAATADGTVWLAGDGGNLARYDRLTGWSTLQIPDWDSNPAASSAVTALALAPDGTGIAVGEGGRIARITRRGAQLDEAGRPCSEVSGPPCGTGETLWAVDIAADGSAMTGGDGATLLWRLANGELRKIPAPPISSDTRITGVALPAPDRAWIATARGEVFAGSREGDRWSWGQAPENVTAQGNLLSSGGDGASAGALRAIALDADGHGYAVGDAGTVLERTGDGGKPWRRLAFGVSDDLTAVALPEGGGSGALIGGKAGAIWTRVDGRFRPARAASDVDSYGADPSAHISGLAVVPALEDGATEAWAALDGRDLGGALLHFSSDASDSLLAPAKPADALPDVPAPRAGELSFVAFGKSDCANSGADPCPGPSGTDALSDLISRRIVQAVVAASRKPGGPRFTVFTGDASDHGGHLTNLSRPTVLNEWVDLVARPLDETGVPVLGAIGVFDLSETAKCVERNLGVCVSEQTTHAGANVFWRQAMVDRVGQDGSPEIFGGLRYRPVAADLLPSTPDVAVPANDLEPAPSSVPSGGARTHYAVDVLDGSRPLARLVFLDSSLGSLRASDPLQQPLEPRGQLAWLDRVLSSRPRGARAVVISTAPSYSYRPGTIADAASDGARLEEVVLKHRASAVVSGRLGLNALYYTLAPGLHCPAPGDPYPDRPPSGPSDCGRASDGAEPARQIADTAHGTRAPAAPKASDISGEGLGSAVPFVISSSAGGKLAKESGEGYWHGYSVIRLDASGDPTKTVAEQRPILDWLVITGREHQLQPGQTLVLRGVGREPPAADTPPRYLPLTDPSITHRYALVVADPEKPWLPYRDDDGRYVAMSDRYPNCLVACINDQTGEVSTGEGADHRVYGIALLSVGDLTATYPLAFEPSSAPPPAQPTTGTTALRGLPALAQRPPPSGSPTGSAPAASSGVLHELPALPGLPPAQSLDVPQLRPPTLVAPPTSSPALGTSTAQQARAPPILPDVPRVSPVPPVAPQVQPAPKVVPQRDDAARREAILAESEDESPLAVDEALDAQADLPWVDLALGPDELPGAEATRRTPLRPDLPMTAMPSAEQPSAWARNALCGGGLALAALSLSCGWLALRRRRVHAAPAIQTSRAPSGRDW